MVRTSLTITDSPKEPGITGDLSPVQHLNAGGIKMNRCIVCGKVISRKKAQNIKVYNGHEYLICCPMCESSFDSNPDHYINVARVALGKYSVSAYNQRSGPDSTGQSINSENYDFNHARLLKNLSDDFEKLEQNFRDIREHFESLADTGGLGGLRRGLTSHRRFLQEMSRKMSIHRGVCEFLVTLSESEMQKKYSNV
jgi:YHS domain-containing protein